MVQLDQAVYSLRRTPIVLRELLGGLPDARARQDYGPDTFSPYDTVGHLIHGEHTDWIPRAHLIMERADRPFEPFDRFAMWSADQTPSLDELLAAFADRRAASLAVLEQWRLEPHDLERTGRHPELGAVTLGQLLATWVVHDLDHLRQLAESLAHAYRDEVGPWREYLPVLTPGPSDG